MEAGFGAVDQAVVAGVRGLGETTRREFAHLG
jgi:hypothetical protein